MFSKFPNILPRFMHQSPQRARNQNPRDGRNSPGGVQNNAHNAGPSGPSTSNKRRWMGMDGSERRPSCGSDQQVCQVDNSKAVITKIAALYAERLMSDITLVINGAEYPAHRLILCASSDVFQVMLMNPNWSESQESRVLLQESIECAESFEHFLKYLYTGILKLELSNVIHLLMLADKYNVKDLITLCLDYMSLHIAAASNHSQLILWYQYMSNFGLQHAAVASNCRNYIKWNLEMVAKSDDFPHLDVDLLVSILADDDIVIYDEFSLFRILEDWLMYQIHSSEADPELEIKMARLVEATMSFIRFPLMSPRQLADLIPRQIVRKYPVLMEHMAIAMAFHNGELESFSSAISSHPHHDKLFTSRLYCTDRWSVCIIADFDKMQHYQSQTLVFSTPCTFADNFVEPQVEWCLDFYPKAVQFQRSFLIGWHGTIEVPEHVLKTVRLSVLCKTEEGRDVRVRIGILIAGFDDGVEHVRRVVRRNYIFSDRDRVLNLDDLIPYGDLNPCASCDVSRRNGGMSQSTNSSGTDGLASSCSSCKSSNAKRSCFVVESQVKVRIVITPLSEILK